MSEKITVGQDFSIFSKQISGEITKLKANQLTWKYPPFKDDDLPKVGDLVVVHVSGDWDILLAREVTPELLVAQSHIIKAFAVIPKPEGVK